MKAELKSTNRSLAYAFSVHDVLDICPLVFEVRLDKEQFIIDPNDYYTQGPEGSWGSERRDIGLFSNGPLLKGGLIGVWCIMRTVTVRWDPW